ncbi:translation initiation factor eIF2B subunit beta-like [Symsagittifera roscoffensis]|uniref:translation initiation factor eIF2B subunit beta-like n=1 Tax=Symsagittifera roscoffensis TaxID=84072 RepID=UPI00307BFCD8
MGSVELQKKVTDFTLKVTNDEFGSLFEVAEKTCKLVQSIILQLKWKSTDNLITYLRSTIQQVCGSEEHLVVTNACSVACNVILRLIKIISIEDPTYLGSTSEQFMSGLIKRQESKPSLSESSDTTKSQSKKELKETFIDCLEEYTAELENSCSNIASQSLDHIHHNEIILTIGYSKTVSEFLKEASQTRKFQVLVSEAAPSYKGHQMARELVDAGINTTLCADSNIFAVMSRVNKVLIGSRLILADGSIMSCAGALLVAQAAQHFSVPVICCGAFYKVTPKYLSSQDQNFSTLLSPQQSLPLKHISSLQTFVANPAYDFVPASYLTLLISSLGGHDPSYIFKLIFDLYPAIDN